MDDETEAGEFYLDSLAIYPEYRRRGIARQLLKTESAEHSHAYGTGQKDPQGICPQGGI